MKILINCSSLNQGGGIQVASSFIYELIELNKDHDYLVTAPENLLRELEKSDFGSNFTFIQYKSENILIGSLLGRHSFLDKLESEHKFDRVFTVFGPSYWRPKCKHICGYARPHYIYKDSPFFKSLTFSEKFKLWIKEKVHIWDFKRNNDLLITENDDVSNRISDLLNKTALTVSNYYHQVFEQEERWDNSLAIEEEGIRLLTVSANYPHKNLKIIKDVIDELNENYSLAKVKFVLTLSPNEIPELNLKEYSDYIVFVGRAKIDQLPILYQSCSFMFLPTLLECFSASYCEAMVMEKPILTSDLSFAKGICGEAAVYFDPTSPQDIAKQIINLIESKSLQKKLISLGKKQLKRFDTSRERAIKYLNIIEK